MTTALEHSTMKAIENAFPIGFVSRLAEHESWRKEVYRPIYYVHKWWARRLGSVFRAIILGCCLDHPQDVAQFFYEPIRFPDVTIFDPFMGSGVAVGEAVKLGCRVIGRDINPVSSLMVRTALQSYSASEVQETFDHLAQTAGARIRALYAAQLSDGTAADVLYYFWVKVVPCPLCGQEVDLFKSRVFARHATPHKHPAAQSLCPQCGAVHETRYDATAAVCPRCQAAYNPQVGAVEDKKVTCPACHSAFTVLQAVRRRAGPPQHRLYAKMALDPAGDKRYLPANEQDSALYQAAGHLLDGLWDAIPRALIPSGYNTNQILNYQYTYWHELFNARQLASLALLAAEIRQIEDPRLRELFACLLSSTLEFNNMFCSFKGEGTGAVRPIFAHHILKPELTPLEANVWGTPKSSGSFSTLFESRILRALEYKARPFEFRVATANGKPQNQKVFGLSAPIDETVVSDYTDFSPGRATYLSTGDSAHVDLPDESVDCVVTDPPFFDNVHYSQLADFFYVWLQHILRSDEWASTTTTRSPHEVQDTDVDQFTAKLAAVFRECYRVLKRDGLLVFTYHHSRLDGWLALYRAVREAGFHVTQAHPVKSEMAVAIPIQQSKSPINFDLVIVCRKSAPVSAAALDDNISLPACLGETQTIVGELQRASLSVSAGDVKVIFLGRVLSRLSRIGELSQELALLRSIEQQADSLINVMTTTPGSLRSSTVETGPAARWTQPLLSAVR